MVLTPDNALARTPDHYDLEHPWNRQPCDTDASWLVFVRYRDQRLPRSLIRAHRDSGVPTKPALDGMIYATRPDVFRWARDHFWAGRVRMWDKAKDEAASKRVLELIGEDARERTARHLDLVNTLQHAALYLARGWVAKLEKCNSLEEIATTYDVPLKDLVQVIKQTIELERLLHGEATQHVHVSGNLDLSRLSVPELEQWRALLEKASGPVEGTIVESVDVP